MSGGMALKIAIDLLHVPSQVRLHRAGPLPDGVLVLLHIVAGDSEAERAAAVATDRSPEVVRQAAAFFVEQILFAPDADSYRVLGADPQATSAELRRNLGLLLRWLHPDLDPKGERTTFVGRVTAAWNDLKTDERRAAYDQARRCVEERRTANERQKPHRKGRPVRSWHDNKRSMDAMVRGERTGTHDTRLTFGFLRQALSVLFPLPLRKHRPHATRHHQPGHK
jgi:DnaJ domain